MADLNTLTFIKQLHLDSKDIFELLKMPPYHGKLRTNIQKNTIILTGDNFECRILFFENHYVIIRKYPGYDCFEFRDTNDEPKNKLTEYYLDDKKLVFAQQYNDEDMLIRTLSLASRGNNICFKRGIAIDEELNSSEVYGAIKSEQGRKAKRTIHDDGNVIVTNYYDFTEPLMPNPVTGHVVSTVSVLPPALVSYLMPVCQPEQLDLINDFENPVIVLDGSFNDLSSVDKTGKVNNHFGFHLLMVKQLDGFEIMFTTSQNLENPALINVPCKGTTITPESIDRLISYLHKKEFFKSVQTEFPFEKRIIQELINIKREILSQMEIHFDYYDMLLNQNNSYEQMAFEIYENLQGIYEEINKEFALEQNKAPSPRQG